MIRKFWNWITYRDYYDQIEAIDKEWASYLMRQKEAIDKEWASYLMRQKEALERGEPFDEPLPSAKRDYAN